MPTKQDQPSTLDELQDDTKAADEDVEYPEGAPEFYPLHRMPFRQRGEATRRYGALQAYLKAHPELTKAAEKPDEDPEPEGEDVDAEVDMDTAADSYEMLALMDEFMQAAAVDQAAYVAWPDKVDAGVFLKTWAAYQAATQPGEASSSSS